VAWAEATHAHACMHATTRANNDDGMAIHALHNFNADMYIHH